jgi:hypothetical protein
MITKPFLPNSISLSVVLIVKKSQFEYLLGPADPKNRIHPSMYLDQFVQDEETYPSGCCGSLPMNENFCGMQLRVKYDLAIFY